MATHSSVLAWRIPGTGEPGGLPSMGSHGVRHDWSDLAEDLKALSRGEREAYCSSFNYCRLLLRKHQSHLQTESAHSREGPRDPLVGAHCPSSSATMASQLRQDPCPSCAALCPVFFGALLSFRFLFGENSLYMIPEAHFQNYEDKLSIPCVWQYPLSTDEIE